MGKSFAIVYETFYIIYYLAKHENVAKSVWKNQYGK